MTAEEFQVLLDRRLKLTTDVLGIKAGEYASAGDRLHNFKRGAETLGKHPLEVCLYYFTKHHVSIMDLVRKAACGGQVSPAAVDEKVGDAVNYLILLEGLFQEYVMSQGKPVGAVEGFLTPKDQLRFVPRGVVCSPTYGVFLGGGKWSKADAAEKPREERTDRAPTFVKDGVTPLTAMVNPADPASVNIPDLEFAEVVPDLPGNYCSKNAVANVGLPWN